MRYHIVLLLACGSPVLGFVSQMRHGGPRPANRASPACLLVFLCLLLLVFRFARRSAWAVFRECLFVFVFVLRVLPRVPTPNRAGRARITHFGVESGTLFKVSRLPLTSPEPGPRGAFIFFLKYAGPGRRVSRAVCRRALATVSRVLEPNTLIVSSHVTAPLTRDVSATKLSHMQPKNI